MDLKRVWNLRLWTQLILKKFALLQSPSWKIPTSGFSWKVSLMWESSSCIDSPLVPSSNLKNIWTNSLPAEYGQQITISLMKAQQNPICIVCFLVSLGWRCLFKAGKSGICAFQCVSAMLVCCAKCWSVSFRKHFYKWVTCILRKLWPDLGRKLLETFFIKIE